MKRTFVYESQSLDGFINLATDEWFLDHVGEDDLVLHFYQNGNAVIIGKNQNPWVECDLNRMEKDGVQLVRRVSGGGAVYHDDGNLNFSFIAGKNRYDEKGQMEMILKAVRDLGIPCAFTGRNDLECDGRKFSGNAFACRKENRQHHGTLLCSADLDRLTCYLTVSPAKIKSKGIASVRSRVCNLNEFKQDLTVRDLRAAILRRLEDSCGYWAEWNFSSAEKEEIEEYRKKHASEEWRFGETPKFDYEWNGRFPWGGVQLLFSFRKGIVTGIRAYSDAMETEICQRLEQLLLGAPFEKNALQNTLLSSSDERIRSLADEKILP